MASSLSLGSITRIGGAVFAVVAAVTLPVLRANVVVDWALQQQFGTGHTYKLKSVRPSFSGFTASDVEIEWGETPVLIHRVWVDVGFIGMLKASFSRNSEKVLENVKITFEDIRNSEGVQLTQADLPVGGVSASPFEAEGCGDNQVWLPAEINSMGLTVGQTDLVLERRTQNGAVTNTESLSTAGIARASLESKGTDAIPGGAWGDVQWQSERWEFEDQGFVAARNAYCARQAKISESDFHSRHMAALSRLMSSEGLSASPEMLALYSDFARTGGSLSIDARYGMKVTSSNYGDIAWGDQLASLSGEMQRADARVPLNWTRTTAQPFQEADLDKTTFEIMLQEGFQFSDTGFSSEAATPADPNADTTVVGADGTRSSSAEVASETLVVSAQAPPPSLAPEMIAIHEDEPEYITDFQQIGKMVGRRIRLERRARPALIAQVLSGDAKQLQVRVRQPGGYADISVPRGEFIRARVF